MRFDEISISSTAPRLLISAADVRTGEFRIFRSHAIDEEPADEITSVCDAGFGGGAPLFRAVHLSGHVYSEGLFAQNPPVRDLADAARGEGEARLTPKLGSPARRSGYRTPMHAAEAMTNL